MAIVDPHTILKTEPCILTGITRVRGDVGENVKDELVWKFEDCEGRMGRINVRPKDLIQGDCTEAGLGCGGSDGLR